jgi:hypothetical protein
MTNLMSNQKHMIRLRQLQNHGTDGGSSQLRLSTRDRDRTGAGEVKLTGCAMDTAVIVNISSQSIPMISSLTDLPNELIVHMGHFLTIPDLIRLRRTCRHLNGIINHHWLRFDSKDNRAYMCQVYGHTLISSMDIPGVLMAYIKATGLDTETETVQSRMNFVVKEMDPFIRNDVVPRLDTIYTFEELTHLARTFSSPLGRQIMGKQTQVMTMISSLMQNRLVEWTTQLNAIL